jgi:hypothetical protein
MRGMHPGIKSMMISVCNFTLLGSKVQTCDSKFFSGPFITYVRADDDFYSLSARLREITGEEDFDKMRLAVVSKNNTAHFLARPSLRPAQSAGTLAVGAPQPGPNAAATLPAAAHDSTTAAAVGAATMNGAAPPQSVWSLIVSHFPEYHKVDYNLSIVYNSSMQEFSSPLPTIGIQRSVSDVSFGDMSNGRYASTMYLSFRCVFMSSIDRHESVFVVHEE